MKFKSILKIGLLTAAVFLGVCGLVGSLYYGVFKLRKVDAVAGIPATQNQRVFSRDELIQYNGTDPEKPIYLAFEGNVYDVSAGKDYYKLGGVYHFLAGKDATSELQIAGGNIIKRKYPVVGTFLSE